VISLDVSWRSDIEPNPWRLRLRSRC